MSDNIPFEMQAEIIRRLPIRSLIQYRSVSKAWKSHIDSSDFIADYSSHQHLLLVSYRDLLENEQKFVTIVEDDTFPQQKASLTSPLSVSMLKYCTLIGSSHGLLCLYNDYRKGLKGPLSETSKAVLWNPSIRKSVDVIVPNVGNEIYATALGFGVCLNTNDPKIVKITYIRYLRLMESISSIPCQVEVFTLSTGAWRSPHNNKNLPRKSVQFDYFEVGIGGFLYWLAMDSKTMDGEPGFANIIISFDLTSEEFGEIQLPDSIASRCFLDLSMYKLKESLVVLDRAGDANSSVIDVWMMEDAVPNSFTKLFTFNTSRVCVRGFRKTGEPIIDIEEDLGINGVEHSFSMHDYMETLLLLDQPDFITYDKGKRHIVKRRANSTRLLKHTRKV